MVSILSVAVVSISIAAAWWLHEAQRSQQQQQQMTSSSNNDNIVDMSSNTAAIYVIGDLHGDVECAQQWVHRTQLINPTTKEWRNISEHLIFLGDYIDKGIQSRQTIEYVKQLTDRYPNQVTALLGNHEIELLRDRSEAIWGGSTARVGYYQLPYATVHPGEYLNYIYNPVDDDSSTSSRSSSSNIIETDRIVVDALYNATIEVYGRGLHRKVFFIPDLKHTNSILHYIPKHLQSIVQERLIVYQKAYIDTYRTGTELGTWLEQRPIVKVLYGTIFMHGGLSKTTASLLRTMSDIQYLNEQFTIHAIESKLHTFLQSTAIGQAIYDLVVYRGNHKEGACHWLPNVLPKGIYRLAVGHTPSSTVRIKDCMNDQHTTSQSRRTVMKSQYDGYSILALDSALSRWFRNSGNDYCSGNHTYQSSNGQYTCHKKVDRCEGQIVRIKHTSPSTIALSSLAKLEDSTIDHQSVQIDIITM
jgi:Calcineurin-like phosphoesterase